MSTLKDTIKAIGYEIQPNADGMSELQLRTFENLTSKAIEDFTKRDSVVSNAEKLNSYVQAYSNAHNEDDASYFLNQIKKLED